MATAPTPSARADDPSRPILIDAVLMEEAERILLAGGGAAEEVAGITARFDALRARIEAAASEGVRPGSAEGAGSWRDPKLGAGPSVEPGCTAAQTRQQHLYRELYALDRAALCLSGGGIRSAAFSLGVMQALAIHPRPRPEPGYLKADATGAKPEDAAGRRETAPAATGAAGEQPPGAEPKTSEQPDAWNRVETAERCLLAQFEYLSTVSGGGYIGSWLSSWRARVGFERIWQNLVGRPCGPDIEPGTLAWLRSYSNYLTPRLGVFSADTWAGAAIAVRNLVLNWLVILPALCAVILLLKIASVFSIGLAVRMQGSWGWFGLAVVGPGLVAVAALVLALAFVTRNRPTRDPVGTSEQPNPCGPEGPLSEADGGGRGRPPRGVSQRQVVLSYVVPSLVSAMGTTQALASTLALVHLDRFSKTGLVLLGGLLGALVYALSWVLARPKKPGSREGRDRFDPGYWAAAGFVYGVLVGLGAHAYALAPHDGHWLFNDVLLPLLFGVPFVLLAQTAAEMVFVGLSSREANADSDREWLGRSAGWVVAVAAGWFGLVFLVFAGSLLVSDVVEGVRGWIASLGGAAAVATAVIGRSSWSSGRGEAQGRKPLTANLILAIAAPVFAAALVIGLSAWLDWLLLDDALILLVRYPDMQIGLGQWWRTLGLLLLGLAIALVVAGLASWTININRFSLHAVYRNRLIRAFLGASALRRDPDAFTDFDIGDNLPVHCLWPKAGEAERHPGWRPFHVINIALNVVSAKRLAWQERKAEPFTVSPLHAGSGCKAFRRSEQYAGPGGITLGTAMAISGAAASPNMGYHSSPAITFLLALLNVRLGWWLGNPGPEGDRTFRDEGPVLALLPLLNEMFGRTTDDQPYVYLSDGGHFENLGLYEMVRRRCRRIVVVDAGADPDYAFEDLGNAVRKIRIDLGVSIHFDGLQALTKRPADDAKLDPRAPYHAVGWIDYPAADGIRVSPADPDRGHGKILYVKAGYHGIEDAGIRNYATANRAFPHETTGDQFFSESQFESYRSLGFEIMDRTLDGLLHGRSATGARSATLLDVFDALR